MGAQGDGTESVPGRRGLILDAALTLIAERGFEGTSTAQIAAAAGVSRTLIFHYFPTKTAVLDAVLAERGVGTMLADVRSPRLGEVEAALLALADQITDRLRRCEPVTRIILNERAKRPAIGPRYEQFVERLEELVTQTVAGNCGNAQPALEVAVAHTFAAVLLRDILAEMVTGVRGDCTPGARVCALALAPPDRRAPTHPSGGRA